jgi:hypothetical protein
MQVMKNSGNQLLQGCWFQPHCNDETLSWKTALMKFVQQPFLRRNPMAKNVKNKYPADKTGTKYSEFRNTKRTAPGKARTERQTGSTGQEGGKTG